MINTETRLKTKVGEGRIFLGIISVYAVLASAFVLALTVALV